MSQRPRPTGGDAALLRLKETEDVVLSKSVRAMCEAAVSCLNLLSEDLQDGIQCFVRDLQLSAKRDASRAS